MYHTHFCNWGTSFLYYSITFKTAFYSDMLMGISDSNNWCIDGYADYTSSWLWVHNKFIDTFPTNSSTSSCMFLTFVYVSDFKMKVKQ